MKEIEAIGMPGIHARFLKYFKNANFNPQVKILDLGAGRGAFTQKLYNTGYQNLVACDLFPEVYEFDKVDCKKADITKSLPFADDSFDVVIAIEVTEHILDHEKFFAEISRILRPDGHLLISTPNILSLKSRFRFLYSGFYYSFNPLEMDNYDGLQHVASLTLNQYNYIAIKNNFHPAVYDIEKRQNTSMWLYLLLFPFLRILAFINRSSKIHNEKKLLLGRLVFLNFKNNK